MQVILFLEDGDCLVEEVDQVPALGEILNVRARDMLVVGKHFGSDQDQHDSTCLFLVPMTSGSDLKRGWK